MAVRLTEGEVCYAHVVPVKGARPRIEDAACVDEATFLHRAAVWQRQRISLLLERGEYQLLTADIPPGVAEAEMRNAMRWRIKDLLDYPADQATLDILHIPMEGGRSASHLFVAVARNDTLLNRQLYFRSAKLPLKAIDLPDMAQRNISALLEEPGRGTAVLVFGPDSSLLTVTYKGELYLSRRLDVGINQLEVADQEKRDAYYERVALELQRSQDGFERQFNFISMSRLWLGAVKHAEELKRYLASQLYVAVESLDLAGLFQCRDEKMTHALQDEETFLRLFAVIGAALREDEAA